MCPDAVLWEPGWVGAWEDGGCLQWGQGDSAGGSGEIELYAQSVCAVTQSVMIIWADPVRKNLRKLVQLDF